MNIGKAARQVGLSVDTVRYYERRELLGSVTRSVSGYRQYADEDIQHLRFIQHAKELGFTLKEIKQLLGLRADGSDCTRVRKVAEKKADDIKDRIEKLSTMHGILLELVQRCESGKGDDSCPVLKSLEDKDA